MAQSNDYVVPHLDGLPYLDKPIAYFAAAAVVMELAGPTETAARLPAYIATLATIALLVSFARRRWGEDAGWLAGLAYATMLLPLAYAHTAIFDSMLTLCTTAAILWFADERSVAAWAAIALGALTKGPIALAIPLLTLVPHAIVTGAPLRRLFPWRGLAVFGAIALPWFIAVSIQHPDFPGYVFLRETLQRVATHSFHRTAPFWYYLPIVPLAAFPWIVPGLARVRAWRRTWDGRRDLAAREPLLLAAWVIVPLLFFSLNQSKLPQYVLPIMPAFALAATRNLVSRDNAGARAYVPLAIVAGLGLVALTRWLPAPISLTAGEKVAIPPTAVAVGVVLFCSAALVAFGTLARRPRAIVPGYAIVLLALPFVSSRLLAAVGQDRSSAAVASATAAALQHATGGAAVVAIRAYPPSLPFYLGRTVAVATETGAELTSNYIVQNVARFRGVAGSPLLPADAWRDALGHCPVPTVFVTTGGNAQVRAALGAALPLVVADDHYAAYGPCRPRAAAQSSQPPQPPRGGGVVR
ncbi:MAG TPA: glycosyltransferase family 39 protein [Gemmatimonadales bacterium]|nr:glycosyltransferase family 39 protein [Gemmatimonadales bacterium]